MKNINWMKKSISSLPCGQPEVTPDVTRSFCKPSIPTAPEVNCFSLTSRRPAEAIDAYEMKGENANVRDLANLRAENLGDPQWAGSHTEPWEQRGNYPSTKLNLKSSQAS